MLPCVSLQQQPLLPYCRYVDLTADTPGTADAYAKIRQGSCSPTNHTKEGKGSLWQLIFGSCDSSSCGANGDSSSDMIKAGQGSCAAAANGQMQHRSKVNGTRQRPMVAAA